MGFCKIFSSFLLSLSPSTFSSLQPLPPACPLHQCREQRMDRHHRPCPSGRWGSSGRRREKLLPFETWLQQLCGQLSMCRAVSGMAGWLDMPPETSSKARCLAKQRKGGLRGLPLLLLCINCTVLWQSLCWILTSNALGFSMQSRVLSPRV